MLRTGNSTPQLGATMIKNLVFLFTLLFSATSFAKWTPVIVCNQGALVVDRNIVLDSQLHQEVIRYQVVIRDPNAVRHLSRQGHLGSEVNSRNEIVVQSVDRRGNRSFGAFIPGSRTYILLELNREANGLFKVLEYAYYGRTTTELANWSFNNCSATEP
jgi:hypothetical protein